MTQGTGTVSSRRFPTTRWSLIHRAGGGEGGKDALTELLEIYRPALGVHLTASRRVPADEAEDVLQSFMLDKIIGDRLIEHADQYRGRFRTFLLNVLDNYLANYRRHGRAQSRRPEHGLASLDQGAAAVRDPGGPASDAFDLEWARRLVAETLRRMERECTASGRQPIWLVFKLRVVDEALGEKPAGASYEEVMSCCGFQSPSQAHSALTTAKRMYLRLLRGLIGEYARDDREIDEEILDLKRVLLSSPRA
jgi:DNA-directed RNA polymerase specialized sigma24 family protein